MAAEQTELTPLTGVQATDTISYEGEAIMSVSYLLFHAIDDGGLTDVDETIAQRAATVGGVD